MSARPMEAVAAAAAEVPAELTPLGLSALDLSKQFQVKGRAVGALDHVDLAVPKGGFVSIIGPSGCGKSTMLRIFADLVDVSSGAVKVNGRSPAEARRNREFGVVFQSPNLLPWRSLVKNVTLPLEVMGQSRDERQAVAAEMLELVGLGGFERHLPRQLSGGMQQRAAIARALAMKPSVLLMDEPFGALDEITRDRLNTELMAIWERLDPTVLFITHSLSEAVFLSSTVVVMSARPGRIVGTIPIGLAHPRAPAETRTDPRFFEYVDRGAGAADPRLR